MDISLCADCGEISDPRVLVVLWLVFAFFFAIGLASVTLFRRMGMLSRPLIVVSLLVSVVLLGVSFIVYPTSMMFALPLTVLIGQLAGRPFRYLAATPN